MRHVDAEEYLRCAISHLGWRRAVDTDDGWTALVNPKSGEMVGVEVKELHRFRLLSGIAAAG
ncbi:MAG: hypothetical protein DWQ34_07670 [Planctomycetota bacterium]|nr:MAG: hypothetical protein DWQ29_18490 [Planctomycetota bacterium]REJ94818.1 MAG: hypothetical protein DWQ34_07670 [Planctomycetota bacterium]REK31052.1 MAG: hypothetical protein DWQ41_01100 [Planctomycetota bacterium]REK36832.1 MAG: hypothetical protein DWQ45_09505 [Planctomycetota bacterium]